MVYKRVHKRSISQEQEVENRLFLEAARFGPPQAWYFNSTLRFLGHIPVPLQRAISLEQYSFSTLSEKERDQIWDAVWNTSDCYEVMSQALYYFEAKQKRLTLSDWKILSKWTERIENWAHSDSLCSMLSSLYENYPTQIYPTLKRWNRSKLPWQRRISIISLFYYARLRKKRKPSWNEAYPLVENLINDPHLYVQKAVGWTIRELYQVYPKQTLSFLTDHIGVLPAAAWQAATEKLSAADKKRLKTVRAQKKVRGQSKNSGAEYQ